MSNSCQINRLQKRFLSIQIRTNTSNFVFEYLYKKIKDGYEGHHVFACVLALTRHGWRSREVYVVKLDFSTIIYANFN